MKNLVKFLKDRRGVSPVIGVILMVAITVVMAAGIAAWMYGYGMPKKVPNMSATLVDDARVTLTGTASQRVAMLTIHGGPNIAPSELRCVVTYTDVAGSTELTRTLDGASWSSTSNITMGTTGAAGTDAIVLAWVDSDGSSDISAGDRLDFAKNTAAGAGKEVKANTDFTVKLIHKPSESVLVDQTIKVR